MYVQLLFVPISYHFRTCNFVPFPYLLFRVFMLFIVPFSYLNFRTIFVLCPCLRCRTIFVLCSYCYFILFSYLYFRTLFELPVDFLHGSISYHFRTNFVPYFNYENKIEFSYPFRTNFLIISFTKLIIFTISFTKFFTFVPKPYFFALFSTFLVPF